MVNKVEITRKKNIVSVDTQDSEDDLEIRSIERVITIKEIATGQVVTEELIFEGTE